MINSIKEDNNLKLRSQGNMNKLKIFQRKKHNQPKLIQEPKLMKLNKLLVKPYKAQNKKHKKLNKLFPKN